MQVLNIIKVKNNSIEEITSFGIIDDQLMDLVIDEVENSFIQSLKSLVNDITEEEIDDALDNGAYHGANYSLSLVWSDFNNVQI